MDENHDGSETVELEGYTVVRKEMFNRNEIWISFNPGKRERRIFIPKKCMSHLGNPPYVQLLVNPEEKKLVLMPLWRKKEGKGRHAARTAVMLIIGTEGSITAPCELLFKKLAGLAGWEDDPEAKYKVYGRAVKTDGGSPLLVFSLDETVFFIPTDTDPADNVAADEEK